MTEAERHIAELTEAERVEMARLVLRGVTFEWRDPEANTPYWRARFERELCAVDTRLPNVVGMARRYLSKFVDKDDAPPADC